MGSRALTSALQNDGHDETVDSQDTRHNDGDERLEDQVVLEHTHGGDTDASLGNTVARAQVAEDEGGGDAHKAEEGVLVGVVNYRSHKKVSHSSTERLCWPLSIYLPNADSQRHSDTGKQKVNVLTVRSSSGSGDVCRHFLGLKRINYKLSSPSIKN